MLNKKTIIFFIISLALNITLFTAYKITNNLLIIVLSIAIIFLALNNLEKNKKNIVEDKRLLITNIIYACLLGIIFMLDSKIVFNKDVGSLYTKNTILPFQIIDILKIIISFIITIILSINISIIFKYNKISIIDQDKTTTTKENIKFWLLFTILTVICWLPFYLTYNPGAVLGDSITSILQGLGEIPFNNHQPVGFSIFVGLFMRIGRHFGNYNLGVALFSITQLTIMASIISYGLLWLKKHKVKMIYILITWLYFISGTLFAKYAIIMWKDPLFSGFLFLLILILFDIAKSNGEDLKDIKTIIKLGILFVLISFFRNNGFIIVSSIYLVLMIIYKKKIIRFDIIGALVLISIYIIQGPIYNYKNIISPFEEKLGIPLQQLSRTVAYDGKINKEEKEYLNELLPIEKYKSNYSPMLVDSVKWDEKFNKEFLYQNKIGFFKTWATLLIPNFKLYVDAYLLDTYGFWSPYAQNEYGFADTYIIWEKENLDNPYQIKRHDIIKNTIGISLEKNFKEPNYIGSGTLFWIMLLVIMILFIIKESKYIISLLPGILTWITIMISTPVAFSLRYVFVLVYALPFMVLFPFIIKEYKKL